MHQRLLFVMATTARLLVTAHRRGLDSRIALERCWMKAAFVPQRRSRSAHTTTTTTPARSRLFSSSSAPFSSHFISVTDALEAWKNSSNSSEEGGRIRFVDGTWYHKGTPKAARQAFVYGPRLPNSVYFDVTELSDSTRSSPIPNMLPTLAHLGQAMDGWDIRRDDHVIVYGQSLAATFVPRVWFTLAVVLQHARVSLLQGTLRDWMDAGGPVDDDSLSRELPDLAGPSDRFALDTHYFDSPTPPPDLDASSVVVQSDNVLQDATTGEPHIVLDARGSSFATGHMPGALHVPYSSLMATEGDGRYFVPTDELKQVFAQAGLDNPNTPQTIVCSCGSGVSACSLYLALLECGRTHPTLLYDGSWQEWKRLPDAPKVLPSDR